MATRVQGTVVLVRAYGGEPFVMRVWEARPEAVLVCSEANYRTLSQGLEGLRPVGVPRQDVFNYDADLARDLADNWQTNPALWQSLAIWKGDLDVM